MHDVTIVALKSKNQSGISLIEVLITCLVMGFGLLGVATLQVASVSSNQEGYFYTQASSIAQGLSSRIRMSKISSMIENRDTVKSDPTPGTQSTSKRSQPQSYEEYLNYYAKTDASYQCEFPQPSDTKKCDENNVNCTLSERAKFDLSQVCSDAETMLPYGNVVINRENNRMQLVVEWLPGSAKKNAGQKKNLNSRCPKSDKGEAIKNCVILELVP